MFNLYEKTLSKIRKPFSQFWVFRFGPKSLEPFTDESVNDLERFSTQPFIVNERDDAEEFVWEKRKRTDLNIKLAINRVLRIGDRIMMWNEHLVFQIHWLDSIRQPIHSVCIAIFTIFNLIIKDRHAGNLFHIVSNDGLLQLH